MNGTSNLLIEGNEMSRPSRTSIGAFYGVYVTEKSVGLHISKNKIHASHNGATSSTTSAAGVYFTASDATAGNENIVSNNMVYEFNNLGTHYGLYNSGSDYVKYYYNSVLLDNQTPTTSTTWDTRAFYQVTAATGIELKNNNFVVTRNAIGENHVLYFSTAATTFTSDYNNLYLATGAGATNALVFRNSIQYNTLADWQATGNDVHSIGGDPLFLSATDLHLQTGSPVNDKGVAVASITTDIDGEARALSTPDIGADELPLAPGIDIQIVKLVSPAVSVTSCYGTETITVAIRNNSVNT
ncbi:MAG: hypothetical protein EON98_16380, partial [Chitinophagaceae bacterium]